MDSNVEQTFVAHQQKSRSHIPTEAAAASKVLQTNDAGAVEIDAIDLCDSSTDDSRSIQFTPYTEAEGGLSDIDAGEACLVSGPRYKVIHRVNCSRTGHRNLYYDEPVLAIHETPQQNAHLISRFPIVNLDHFMGENPNLAFIVIRQYDCGSDDSSAHKVCTGKCTQERLLPLSASLKEAFRKPWRATKATNRRPFVHREAPAPAGSCGRNLELCWNRRIPRHFYSTTARLSRDWMTAVTT